MNGNGDAGTPFAKQKEWKGHFCTECKRRGKECLFQAGAEAHRAKKGAPNGNGSKGAERNGAERIECVGRHEPEG